MFHEIRDPPFALTMTDGEPYRCITQRLGAVQLRNEQLLMENARLQCRLTRLENEYAILAFKHSDLDGKYAKVLELVQDLKSLPVNNNNPVARVDAAQEEAAAVQQRPMVLVAADCPQRPEQSDNATGNGEEVAPPSVEAEVEGTLVPEEGRLECSARESSSCEEETKFRQHMHQLDDVEVKDGDGVPAQTVPINGIAEANDPVEGMQLELPTDEEQHVAAALCPPPFDDGPQELTVGMADVEVTAQDKHFECFVCKMPFVEESVLRGHMAADCSLCRIQPLNAVGGMDEEAMAMAAVDEPSDQMQMILPFGEEPIANQYTLLEYSICQIESDNNDGMVDGEALQMLEVRTLDNENGPNDTMPVILTLCEGSAQQYMIMEDSQQQPQQQQPIEPDVGVEMIHVADLDEPEEAAERHETLPDELVREDDYLLQQQHTNTGDPYCGGPMYVAKYEEAVEEAKESTASGAPQFECFDCKSSYDSLETLREHMSTVCCRRPAGLSSAATGNIHACCHCGKTFSRKKYLHNHIEHFAIDGQFDCEYTGCSQTFTIECALDAHSLTHDGRFVCRSAGCGKTYQNRRSLQRHFNAHDGALLSCDYPACTFESIFIGSLNKHKRKHDRSVGGRRASGKGASPKKRRREPTVSTVTTGERAVAAVAAKNKEPAGILKVHICTVCQQAFKYIYELKEHKREHTRMTTKQRVYKCEHIGCTKQFDDRNILQQHAFQHAESSRPFVCPHPQCGKSFPHKRSLQSHEKFHAKSQAGGEQNASMNLGRE